MKDYSHVIWDWNGTLLDDAAWCMQTINTLLRRRQMKELESLTAYRDVFCFPVIQYYRNVGFDFAAEPFEALAQEYMALYHSPEGSQCPLHENALDVLQEIHRRNVCQIILSASEKRRLMAQVNQLGIPEYFDEILGLSDIFAQSKVAMGLDYLRRTPIRKAVVIGDTAHDAEVARAMGVDCILLAAGHQNRDKLLTCGMPIADNMKGLLKLLFV